MTRTEQRRDSRGGRFLGLGLLASAVALAMLYLSDCMPGFGTGGSSAPATNAPAAAQSDVATTAADATLSLTVDGDRCSRAGAAAEPCLDLCRSLGAEAKTKPRKILVNGTLGTHAAVDGLRRCLAEQGLRDVVVRTE